MTEDEKAYYEEWKRKCAATRARKKQERAQENAKLLKDKTGYRIPTRGSKKGQLVWMGYRQQQIDMNMARNAEKNREAAAKRALEAAQRSPTPITQQTPSSPATRPSEALEVILAFLFVCAVTLGYVFIARGIARLGFLGPAILLDFFFYSILAKKSYRSRYAPFVWWFLQQRK